MYMMIYFIMLLPTLDWLPLSLPVRPVRTARVRWAAALAALWAALPTPPPAWSAVALGIGDLVAAGGSRCVFVCLPRGL